MKSLPLILSAILLASPSASFAASGARYYVVLTDVLGAAASNFAGPYATKAACQADAKVFQARDTSPVAAYICVLRKKAEIAAMTDKDRQALEQARLGSK